jgi:hypothetical protein
MKLPRKLLVGVFTIAAANNVVALAGYDNYKFSATQQPATVTQMAQQTATPQQAPVKHSIKASDLTSEEQARMAALEAYDQNLLAGDGYKATARLDYGKCNGSSPAALVDPGLHYHGTSTCIEYAAVVTSGAHAGQHVHIYVRHHGVPGDVTHTKFTAVKGPALSGN